MRNISVAMKAHLASGSTTLCACWKITRTDGMVLGFTNNSADLVYQGITYKAASGMLPSSVSSSSGLSVDNLEITSVFTQDGVTDRDMRAGLYDHAEMTFFLVNYDDLSMGHIFIKRGWIGQVNYKAGKFVSEFRSLTQATLSEIVENTRQTCRCRLLGDERCKLNLDGNTLQGIPIRNMATVSAVTNTLTFTVAFDVTRTWPQNFYRKGIALFQSGQNNLLACEVRSSVGATMTLQQPSPFAIAVGDRVRMQTGCDRRIETCGGTFGNNANFRGEPYVPGPDKTSEIN